MISATVAEINKHLKKQLPWLDEAFGQSLEVNLPAKRPMPCIYLSSNEYKSVLPDNIFGNYCFWEVADTQTIEYIAPDNRLRYEASILFWINLESIFGKHYSITHIDELKDDIIATLGYKHYKLSQVTLKRVSTGFRNLFSKYMLSDEHTQFLMLPYQGFKFDITILERKIC